MTHISLKQSKLIVNAASGVFFLLGIFAGIKSENTVGKNLAWTIASTSVMVGLINNVATSFHEDKANEQADRLINARDGKIKSLQEKLTIEIETATNAQTQLQSLQLKHSGLEKYHEDISTELAKLTKLRQVEKDSFIKAMTAFIQEIKYSLTNHIETNYTRLVDSVNSRIRIIKDGQKIDECEHVLKVLHKLFPEIDHKKKLHLTWVAELVYNPETNINTNLTEALDLITQIHEEIQSIRSKYRNTLVIGDKVKLRNSVHKEQAKQALQKLSATASEEIANINQKTAEYEEVTANNDKFVQNLIKDFETLRLRIAEQDEIIKELRKPVQFYGNSEYARAGNDISLYYYKKGYKLDCINWIESETGYSIIFAIRQNPGITLEQLYENDGREQLAAYTNALYKTLPEFEINYQQCLLTLTVVKRRKKQNAHTDIDKIWIPANKFESYVRNWERVRITAGSTGGKSPTAKNLALAIMNSRKGQGEIRLYDPQHGSKKDFWNMPKDGISHEDNLDGMRELCELIEKRRNGKNHTFVLYLFDEIDNTVASLDAGDELKNLIKISLKEGSHASIGVIYIGQSSDANEVPGMTHSTWNNAVQLHIGSNAGNWLDSAKSITNEDKTRLLEQYRKIQEFCDDKNEELGLDIFTDATAYRFALAVPLTGLPKFIQLPDFDTYDYYEVMSNSVVEVERVEPVKVETTIVCPHCESTNIKKNGQTSKGEQYYTCLDCDKTPKRWRI